MNTIWCSAASSVLTNLIKAELAAFRETLDQPDAIDLFDKGRTGATHGYWTNLGIDWDKLAQEESILKQITDVYRNCLPQWLIDGKSEDNKLLDDNIRGALDPRILWPDGGSEHTITKALIEKLGLPILEEPIDGKYSLAIVSTRHTQTLVDKWIRYEQRVAVVMILLGTSCEHIRVDLNLPSERYSPLLSVDVLRAVDAKVTRRMIPEAKE